MSTRVRAIVALVLAFGSCIAGAADSVLWRSESLYGVNVQMHYPVVIGAGATRLNPAIERWIGGNCARSPILRNSYLRRKTYHNARDCLTALSERCAALEQGSGAGLAANPCQAEVTARVRTDVAGLLVIELDSYGSTNYDFLAIPHQGWAVDYLNLDIRSGRTLGLSDLLKLGPPYVADLERLTIRALHTQFHIPANRTLRQAGFDTDQPPLPSTVAVLPSGLLIVYRPSELRFPTGARSSVVLPYPQLSGMIRENGPLSRLWRVPAPIH
jgi:hypothetical protein